MGDLTENLVRLAQGGAGDAYEALFARVAERLLLYVRLRLGTRLGARVEALDVVQETYLLAHRDFERYRERPGASFSAWLYRIADNRLRDLSAHHAAAKREALREAAQGSAVLARLCAEATGPATEADRRDRADALGAALDELDELEREALLLRHFHDLTLDAIAEQLGTSEPSVRRAIGRGQVKLGARLQSLRS